MCLCHDSLIIQQDEEVRVTLINKKRRSEFRLVMNKKYKDGHCHVHVFFVCVIG